MAIKCKKFAVWSSTIAPRMYKISYISLIAVLKREGLVEYRKKPSIHYKWNEANLKQYVRIYLIYWFNFDLILCHTKSIVLACLVKVKVKDP